MKLNIGVLPKLFCLNARRLMSYIFKYQWTASLTLICMIISATTGSLNVYVVKVVIDFMFADSAPYNLEAIMWGVGIVCSLRIISEYLQNYLVKLLGFMAVNDLQVDFYKAFIHLYNLGKFNHTQENAAYNLANSKNLDQGEILARFASDVQIVRNAFTTFLVGIARHMISVTFLVCMMFYINYKFACIGIGLLPLVIVPTKIIGKKIRGLATNLQANYAAYISSLRSIIYTNRTYSETSIMASSNESHSIYNIDTAKEYSQKGLKIYKHIIKIDSIIPALSEMVNCMVIIMLIFYGKVLVDSGEASIGDIVGFIAAFHAFYRPLKSLITLSTVVQDCIASAMRIFEVIDYAQEIQTK